MHVVLATILRGGQRFLEMALLRLRHLTLAFLVINGLVVGVVGVVEFFVVLAVS